MIETLVLTLALSCSSTADFPDHSDVQEATLGIIPPDITTDELEAVFGSETRTFETAAPVDEWVTWRVVIDPAYQDHQPCFSQVVAETLNNELSWPLLREARANETPQVYIRLAPPSSCATWRHSCARGGGTRGIVDINAFTWFDMPEDFRVFILNHEVGHMLGLQHDECDDVGTSVMNGWFGECGEALWPSEMQRSLSLLQR